MKRLIALIFVCLLLAGCETTNYEDAKNVTAYTTCGGYFTVIAEWGDIADTYMLVYANDTKVKYLIWRGTQKGDITPLYNADGSLQVYEE